MNKNNTTFESGQYYTLSQLFSGDNKIVIPDLQRDYCWGNNVFDKDGKQQPELVSGFVQNLIDLYKENPNDKQTLGLIYGYEHPKRHIQLCDGQQRITTLFLLLGMLNRKANNKFQEHLISDFELKNDDREPNLQYAIRESTLYFLSDLVCQFFLKSDIQPDKIKSQDWYFAEYDLDASIQSMLAAIETIDDKIKDIDCATSFGDFILNKLQMLYYDVGDRAHGEETFVVINTTGEPLTATENLKPVLLGKLDDEDKTKHEGKTDLEFYSDQWEEREDWFWQNRTPTSKTADGGVNDFFVWYWQIHLLQEQLSKNKKPIQLNPKELFSKLPKIDDDQEDTPRTNTLEEARNLDVVHSYFRALSRLINLCKDEKVGKVLKTIEERDIKEEGDINLAWFRKRKNNDLHVVLPLIVYVEKFETPTLFYEFVRRIRKNYFDNKRNRGNFVDWRHIIQIIELSKKEADVLRFETKTRESEFKKISNVTLNEWYNDDEKKKDALKKDHKEDIEHWEDNIDLMGDLTPLWKANEGNENSFENMNHIWDIFELLYNCYDERKSKENPELSNWVRLYRVLIEKIRIGHISNTSGMKGAWFSWSDKNDKEYFTYLTNNDFLCLLKIEKDRLLNEIQNRVKDKISKSEIEELKDDDNFSAEKHLKIWMLLKVLYAKDKLLAFLDGNGLASYDDCKKNKLDEKLPFSLGNSICGYPVKRYSSIKYATNDNYWKNKSDIIAFDCSIGEILSVDEFAKRKEKPIPEEKIKAIDKIIKELLDEFYQS
jgi:hypothetical protein